MICAYCKEPMEGRVYMREGQPMHWKCRTRANADTPVSTEPQQESDIRAGTKALWHYELSHSLLQPRPCRVLAVKNKMADIEFFDKKTKTTREVRVMLANLTVEQAP